MHNPPNILVVDDEPGMLSYVKTVLELDSYKVSTVPSGSVALEELKAGSDPDLVLLDLVMPGIDGLKTLEEMQRLRPGLKVIMLSCVSDTPKVVQAIKLGAQDYLTKPFQREDLQNVLKQSLETSDDLSSSGSIHELGEDRFFYAGSPAMQKIQREIGTIANVDVPVLILGESGSGKEMVARMIYKASARSHRTFLKVNCAALPDNLLESELFGYEQGAFTGAQRSKPGKFELCDKGTILLDEIGEMSPAIQAKLLHVLQDQEFSRLGSRSSVRVDVRILAATNIDVSKALASKKLREDLYYRLCAFTINVPPLRERKSEVPALMRQFMTRYSESYGRPPLPISQRLIDACQRYPWPGNLRELSNFVRRYLILADESWAISELNAGPKDSFTEGSNSPLEVGAPKGLKSIARDVKSEAEAQAIVQALEQARYNRRKAAVALEISYKALLYKIKKYGIVIPSRSVAPDPYKLHF